MTLNETYRRMDSAQSISEARIYAALYSLRGGTRYIPTILQNTEMHVVRAYLATGYYFTRVDYTNRSMKQLAKAILSFAFSQPVKLTSNRESVVTGHYLNGYIDVAYRSDSVSAEIRACTHAFRFRHGDEKDAVRAFYMGFMVPLMSSMNILAADKLACLTKDVADYICFVDKVVM